MREKVAFGKYNTVDLDNGQKSIAHLVFVKISSQPCCLMAKLSFSCFKGFHIAFVCEKKCDLCRFVFDDPYRYFFDLFRPEASQNVLNSDYSITFTRSTVTPRDSPRPSRTPAKPSEARPDPEPEL